MSSSLSCRSAASRSAEPNNGDDLAPTLEAGQNAFYDFGFRLERPDGI